MRRVAFLSLGLILAGCAGSAYPVSQKTRLEANRLHEIRRRTGGHWNRLTSEEKRFLVEDLSQGNEATAPLLLGAPDPRR